jgi:hypothetical protein
MTHRLRSPIPFLALFLLLGAGSLVQSACTNRATYNTLAGVGLAVSTAIDEFAQAEVKGQVEPGTSAKVWAAYGQYLVAYNHAIDVAKLTPDKPAPVEVLRASAAVIDIVESLLAKRKSR